MTDADLRMWIGRFAARVRDEEAHLTELDAAIGDADHGANLRRGLDKAETALKDTPAGNLQATAKTVGMTMMSTVGGASGALLGTFWMRLAPQLPPGPDADDAAFVAGLEAGVAGIRERGKAEAGDKTMVDVWLVGTKTLREEVDAGESFAAALQKASDAAGREAERTVELVARRGRASYLGERSRGHMDPGSRSTVLFFESGTEALADR